MLIKVGTQYLLNDYRINLEIKFDMSALWVESAMWDSFYMIQSLKSYKALKQGQVLFSYIRGWEISLYSFQTFFREGEKYILLVNFSLVATEVNSGD